MGFISIMVLWRYDMNSFDPTLALVTFIVSFVATTLTLLIIRPKEINNKRVIMILIAVNLAVTLLARYYYAA
jgi:multisubunit Na+/H+ antiporter MnhE subunit